ncbi:MAG TPA: ATP-binding protein [Pirellulales bacterium]
MNDHLPMTALIVEDDDDTRANLRDILELDGFHVEAVATAREALTDRDWSSVGMVVLDRRLPDGSAEDLLPRLKELAPEADVIVATGYADLDGAIAALRNGAADYVLKPINAHVFRNRLTRIVDRRRLTQAKARSDAAFRSLVEVAPSTTFILRLDGTIAYLNPYAEKLTGYAAGEVEGRDFAEIFATGPAESHWTRRLVNGPRCRPIRKLQDTVRCKDGSCRLIAWNAEPLEDFRERPALLAIGHDLTELHEAQQKALQAERLAAIGQMMAGLTHESRNALQRSKACLDMLEMEVEDRPAALELVQRIERAQNHLQQLYEEVRDYAAPIVLEREPCDLRGIWRECWSDLAHVHEPKRIELEESVAAGGARCSVDRFRLNQVFRNIFENAISEMAPGGRMSVCCREATLAGRPALRISFIDSGPGLTDEQRAHIFEPFFTTKAKGTGLGMPICRRIIQAHGGQIEAGERRAPGAEILVILPGENK